MVGSGFPHPCGGVQLPFNWTKVALLKVHLIVSWRRRTDWTCWMELGQGTRQNLNAQRCTLSSIGFSVFSLCLYVLGFYKNPVVNKSSYFYGNHCLLRRVFVPATSFYQATSHMVRWLARAFFHIPTYLFFVRNNFMIWRHCNFINLSEMWSQVVMYWWWHFAIHWNVSSLILE